MSVMSACTTLATSPVVYVYKSCKRVDIGRMLMC